MKGHIFLDTHVLVYLFDADDPAKQRRVQELLSSRELRARVILSTQVLQEFFSRWFRLILLLILLAIQRSHKAKISFWDALILEAALISGATVLYSEDFQDGGVFGGLRVTNPFKVSV